MNRACYRFVVIALLILGVGFTVPAFGQDKRGAPPPGAVGIEIERNLSGNMLISRVQIGSTADEAGLRAGDEILSIDGTDVARFGGAGEVSSKIRGSQGTSVQLKIKRKEEERTVTVLRGSAEEAARAFIVRGVAATEMAKNEADLTRAAVEFKRATEIAPNMAAAWYNLGSVQAKTGQLQEAIESYRQYLILVPGVDNARQVKDEIIKLQYRLEQVEGFKGVSGYWISELDGSLYKVSLHDGAITLQGSYLSPAAIILTAGGKDMECKTKYCLDTRLSRRNEAWVGSWGVPGWNLFNCPIPVSEAAVEAHSIRRRAAYPLRSHGRNSRRLRALLVQRSGPAAGYPWPGPSLEEVVLWDPMPAGLQGIYEESKPSPLSVRDVKGVSRRRGWIEVDNQIITIVRGGRDPDEQV